MQSVARNPTASPDRGERSRSGWAGIVPATHRHRRAKPMTAAWLMISAGEDRQHGGNEGCEDDPGRHDPWDSTVADQRKPRAGHAIVLWDRRILIGVIIEPIDEARGLRPP